MASGLQERPQIDSDRHRGTPNAPLACSSPVRYSCFLPCRACRRRRAAQRFFPRSLADPPAQEVTTEFLISESGGIEPRKGTAWKVHYARGMHKGLYITGAWFKRDLGEDWIKVLNDARIAELFVPYHQSGYIRYLRPDQLSVSVERGQGRGRRAVRHADAPIPGRSVRHGRQGNSRSRGGLERLRPRRSPGPRAGASGVPSRRAITCTSCRMLFMMTARSLSGSARPGKTCPGTRYEAHIHSAHWRIDIDLFDGKKNSAMLMKHVEDPASLTAEDVKEPFNGGLEGGVDWDPKEFTMIRVQCEKQERPRRDDRLRPDADCDTARRGTTKSSPGTTSGSPGRIPNGRWNLSSPTCRT